MSDWRVYRFEHPSGRYVELATKALAPEQIQLPPDCRGFKFAQATPLVPATEAEGLRLHIEKLRSRITDLKKDGYAEGYKDAWKEAQDEHQDACARVDELEALIADVERGVRTFDELKSEVRS